MKPENVAFVGEQLKNQVAEVVEKTKDFSGKVKDSIDSAYYDARRGLRRAKDFAEDTVEETRHEIKTHPFAAVAITAAGAFTLGALAGWFMSSRQDRG
jgi:ElaB/YqjD/DUF883 family membrane-anchored ribosome-binding protein